MRYSREWEQIDKDTLRLKTPEGWLISYDYTNIEGYPAHSMCFVPDKNSAWELAEEEKTK